jgi:hypothetical protein
VAVSRPFALNCAEHADPAATTPTVSRISGIQVARAKWTGATARPVIRRTVTSTHLRHSPGIGLRLTVRSVETAFGTNDFLLATRRLLEIVDATALSSRVMVGPGCARLPAVGAGISVIAARN